MTKVESEQSSILTENYAYVQQAIQLYTDGTLALTTERCAAVCRNSYTYQTPSVPTGNTYVYVPMAMRVHRRPLMLSAPTKSVSPLNPHMAVPARAHMGAGGGRRPPCGPCLICRYVCFLQRGLRVGYTRRPSRGWGCAGHPTAAEYRCAGAMASTPLSLASLARVDRIDAVCAGCPQGPNGARREPC